MKLSPTKTDKAQRLYDNYVQSIPESLHDILIPVDSKEQEHLLLKLRALRIIEEERRYVLDIQNHYNLPIRPNEPVKQTMIRVRLSLLKLRKRKIKGVKPLPVDPLE